MGFYICLELEMPRCLKAKQALDAAMKSNAPEALADIRANNQQQYKAHICATRAPAGERRGAIQRSHVVEVCQNIVKYTKVERDPTICVFYFFL